MVLASDLHDCKTTLYTCMYMVASNTITVILVIIFIIIIVMNNNFQIKFNVISSGSSIHDHADSHCFMKVLDGKLLETKFAWPSKEDRKKPMKVLGTSTYEKDQVAYINGK